MVALRGRLGVSVTVDERMRIEVDGSTLAFDVSAETLRCTIGLDRVGDVNVEMALRLADRLGGHLMTGHVDGVGTVTRFDAVANDPGGSWFLEIEAPAELARFIAAIDRPEVSPIASISAAVAKGWGRVTWASSPLRVALLIWLSVRTKPPPIE